jgi:DNA replication and repair protein RecF
MSFYKGVRGKALIWVEEMTVVGHRNLETATIAFDPRFNLISGQNAQGKTSLLEAIYALSSSQILRGTRDAEAIQTGFERCSIRAKTAPSGTELGLEIAIGKRKRGLINGLAMTRASDLIGRLPGVVFWSGDLNLATGEPAFRRLMLDTELSQIYPAYLKAFSGYKRALQQRNALLKLAQEQPVSEVQFESWEEPMVRYGVAMREMRQEWLAVLRPFAMETHAYMGRSESLELNYEIAEPGELSEQYSVQRRREIARGATLFGPHRDDLALLIDGRPVRQFGSQGQQRTAVIAIKLAVLHAAQNHLGFPPILLLDDIFSDLDADRRIKLVESAMKAGGQVFITCTESEQAGDFLGSTAKRFVVQSGRVEEL